MNTCYTILRRAIGVTVVALLGAALLHAQDSRNFTVQLSAEITKTPFPTITLNWVRDPRAGRYTIWRKLRTDAAWSSSPLAELDSTVTSYADDDIEPGIGYEYQVFKQVNAKLADTSVFAYIGTGYIYAGIERAPEALPGKVLLLVDSTMASPLASEIDRLVQDLAAEGWKVVRRNVARAEAFNGAAVLATKAVIMEEYNKVPKDLTTIFIIGRVAVPHSGAFNPDGHGDHRGAWPADIYYGDVRGKWTDVNVRDTSASRAVNRNIPGDGKFDFSAIPTQVKLAVGRADFYDMPAFTDSETELLRKYLNKDHAFRTGTVQTVLGGIVDDNFSAASYPEAFASAGWRNISVFGGGGNVRAADWFGTLGGDTTYLWAYGCGGGTYTSAGGIGSTTDFTTKRTNAVFTMLFGSYFGDWDSQNNFLRASLCGAGTTLTCAWVARPQWYFHHMALGETIGYSTVLSQNNGTTYLPNVYYSSVYPDGVIQTFANTGVHVALMGDPTLRARMSRIPSPGPLTVTHDTEGPVQLKWGAASGPVDGYFIYRAPHPDSTYRLMNTAPVTGLEFADGSVTSDVSYYIVRSAVLRSTASGTYYDAGAGVTGDIRLAGVGDAAAAPTISMSVAPNPITHGAAITVTLPASGSATLSVRDMFGAEVRRMHRDALSAGTNVLMWDGNDESGEAVPSGGYVILMETATGTNARKVLVTR